MALQDTFSALENLLLETKNKQHESREYIYEVLGLLDATTILDLHENAVRAIAGGSQPYGKIVASEFSAALANARALSRTKPEEERAALLNLTNVAFQSNIIGLDSSLAENHDTGGEETYKGTKPTFRRRTGNVVAHAAETLGTTESWNDGWQDDMEDPEIDSDPENIVAAAAYDDGRGHLRRGNQPEMKGTRTLDPIEAQTAPFKIDFKVVQIAAAEEDGPRKRLAISIFPEDAACKSYWKKGEEEGFPKATVIQRDEFGNPVKRPFDGSIDCRYQQDKDCRFCALTATNPTFRISTVGWSEEVKLGKHNPRTCSRALAYVMKQGAVSADFLMDRKWAPKGSLKG